MKLKTIPLSLLSMMFMMSLSGCSSFFNETQDQQDFHRAMPVTPPTVPVAPQTITVDKSKLMHVTPQSKASNISGVKVVQRANKNALMSPTPATTNNAIIVFPYVAGNLYEIYTTPLNITDVALQPGESIISFGAGDTSRWQISRTASGSGSSRIEHLVIKPLMEDLNTTMIITTNVRTYHLILKSTKDTFMAAVQWQYNDDGSLTANASDNQSNQNIPGETGGAPTQYDFAYQLDVSRGDKPDWYPLAVFNDGTKTYIEFPKKIQSAPALFIKDSVSGDAAVNYRVMNNYYVVDQVFTAAELTSNDGQTQVTLTYKSK